MAGKKNYYYDTEFIEGKQKRRWGKETPPTIDLISIGMVDSKGRSLYMISKDFNLREAWNRYDEVLDKEYGFKVKVFWIRENVLRPIFDNLQYREENHKEFTYKNLKYYINKYGNTNEEIRDGVIGFIGGDWARLLGWYSAYDHVVLMWLFGKMIDKPKNFPMYTTDLKQLFDEKIDSIGWRKLKRLGITRTTPKKDIIKQLKSHKDYPVNKGEHSAIEDAKWNKNMHQFIEKWL